jgi:uncharacterized coiled-coil protein SlyX
MGRRKRIDPEVRARWAELRRQTQTRIDELTARIAEERERDARRQDRLRRLTFGLLGR